MKRKAEASASSFWKKRSTCPCVTSSVPGRWVSSLNGAGSSLARGSSISWFLAKSSPAVVSHMRFRPHPVRVETMPVKYPILRGNLASNPTAIVEDERTQANKTTGINRAHRMSSSSMGGATRAVARRWFALDEVTKGGVGHKRMEAGLCRQLLLKRCQIESSDVRCCFAVVLDWVAACCLKHCRPSAREPAVFDCALSYQLAISLQQHHPSKKRRLLLAATHSSRLSEAFGGLCRGGRKQNRGKGTALLLKAAVGVCHSFALSSHYRSPKRNSALSLALVYLRSQKKPASPGDDGGDRKLRWNNKNPSKLCCLRDLE